MSGDSNVAPGFDADFVRWWKRGTEAPDFLGLCAIVVEDPEEERVEKAKRECGRWKDWSTYGVEYEDYEVSYYMVLDTWRLEEDHESRLEEELLDEPDDLPEPPLVPELPPLPGPVEQSVIDSGDVQLHTVLVNMAEVIDRRFAEIDAFLQKDDVDT